MSKIRTTVLTLIFVSVILVFGILFLLSYEPHQHDTVEYLRRVVCESREKTLYSALVKYHTEYNILPKELTDLVKVGLIKENEVMCPTPSIKPFDRLYKYSPASFGDANLPIISESDTNHIGIKLHLKKLKPVIIETMGDGKVVLKEIPLQQSL